MDGTNVETVEFSLDGVSYQIDLNDTNASTCVPSNARPAHGRVAQ